LAPPPAAVPELPRPHAPGYAETWIPLSRWARENGFGTLREISSTPLQTFALHTGNGIFFVHINSLVADWDGLELHLGFEPQLINGLPFVHFLDLKKNIEPLIRSVAPPAKTNWIVVIDPGHGGQNTGTTSVTDGVPEKEFTLDWARRLEPLLASNGWQVVLTRTNDVDVPLSDRVAIAEEHHADLFISLHFNSAAPSREQAGLETYCLTPAGLPSTLTRGYEDDLSLVFTNNAFDAENLRYAFRLHRALAQVIGNDRGVRHARFLGVLRGQSRPAVLIEGGYLSNPGEARRIADPAYRQKLAVAVAEGLAEKPEAGNRRAEDGAEVLTTWVPTSGIWLPASDFRFPASGLRSSNSPADNAQLH
jgi:N-acetylmuramoyl-L-alanine amidase